MQVRRWCWRKRKSPRHDRRKAVRYSSLRVWRPRSRRWPRSDRRRYGHRRCPPMRRSPSLRAGMRCSPHFGNRRNGILDLPVVIRCEVTVGFVEEALSKHVDGNDVLPIVHLQAGGAGLMEDGTARLPVTAIIILVADGDRVLSVQAKLASLVIEAPQRGANCHRCDLTRRVLIGPGHTREAAIFRSQSWVELAAEFNVAGVATSRDDHRLACPDAQNVAFVRSLNSGDATGAGDRDRSRSCGVPARSRHQPCGPPLPRGRIRPLPVDRVAAVAANSGSPVCAMSQCIGTACISRGTELPIDVPPKKSGALSANMTPWASSQS